MQAAELIRTALMDAYAARDQSQLRPLRGAVSDINTVRVRDVQRDTLAAVGGCPALGQSVMTGARHYCVFRAATVPSAVSGARGSSPLPS